MKFKKKILSILLLTIILGSYVFPVIDATDIVTEEKQLIDEEIEEATDDTDLSEEEVTEESNEVEVTQDSEETNLTNAPPIEEAELDETEVVMSLSIDEFIKNNDTTPNSNVYQIVTPEVITGLRSNRNTYNVTPIGTWGGDLSSFGTYAWGDLTMYKINGNLVYCVEFGVDVASISTQTNESSNIYNSFNITTKDVVEHIGSYASERYEETGNPDYLYAGQILIWEAITPSQWSTVNTGTNLQSELDEIYNLYSQHANIPSFTSHSSSSAKANTLKWNSSTKQYEATLTDSNKVNSEKLEELVGTYGDYKVTKTGSHSLKVTTTNHNATSKTISSQYIPYGNGTNKFYDAGQDMISASADPLKMYVNFEIEPAFGDVAINKTGESLDETDDTMVDLGGAEFELRDGEDVVASGTTDENGDLFFSDITLGDYELVEVTAPNGYLVADDTNIIVEPNETTSVDIIDKQIEGNIEIYKTGESLDETDKSVVDLSGTEFVIYQDTNLDGNYETEIDTLITDKNGYAKYDNLNYGSYKIVETKATEGYIANYEQEFVIDKNGETLSYDVVNDHIQGNLTLQKLGQEYDGTYETLKDVEFTLYQDVNHDGTYETTVDSYYTDNLGIILAENLDYGDYKLVETNVGDNYYADFESEFEIRIDGETITLDNNGEYVINEKIQNNIAITKSGETLDNNSEDKVNLEGTEFTLYTDLNSNGELEMYETVFFNSTSTITDESGLALFENIDITKDYIVKETNATEGYVLDEDEIYVINSSTPYVQNEDVRTYEIEVDNDVIKGQIDLHKVLTYNDKEEDLSDVTFAIYQDLNENEVIDRGEDKPLEYITTNEEGYALSSELKYGTYIVKEVDVPTGVILDDETIYVAEIKENEVIVTLNDDTPITNEAVSNEINVKKTDVATGEEIEGAQIVVYDEDGEVYEEWTSDGSEHVFDAIYGNYTMCETVAPEGYQLLEQCVDFSVTEDGINQEFVIENEMIKSGFITLTKTDAQTGEKLPGATFELLVKNEAGEYVTYVHEGKNEYTTTSEGTIVLDNVLFGSYALREIKAPNGYVVNDTLIPFEVTEDGVDIELSFDNSEEPQIVNTGVNYNTVVLLGLLVILVIIYVIIRLRNRN